MSNDQFTKLFKYIEDFRSEVNKRFEEESLEHADIRAAIGELSAQVRDYHNEMKFMSHQMDKLRDAILQIAKETGVKLQVEIRLDNIGWGNRIRTPQIYYHRN